MPERFSREEIERIEDMPPLRPGVTHFARDGKVWKVVTVGQDYVEAEFVAVMTPPR